MFVESAKRRSRGQEVRGDCQELGGKRVRKSLGSRVSMWEVERLHTSLETTL